MQCRAITPKFVEVIPETLEPGVLYISMQYRTATHKCCCGCGHEVVTPLGPTYWRLTREGDLVSLFPSIGSWALPCRSHYWIKRNAVLVAEQWSDARIANAQKREREVRAHVYERPPIQATPAPPPVRREGFWSELWRWLLGKG